MLFRVLPMTVTEMSWRRRECTSNWDPGTTTSSSVVVAAWDDKTGIAVSKKNENGLVHLASKHSAEETMKRLESLLAERGIQVFARIDHSGEAEKVGLTQR